MRYLALRLAGVPITLFVIVLATFAAGRFTPGDPVAMMAGASVPQEVIDRVRASYGLDQPVLVQFGRYLAGLAQGDFGVSYVQRGTPVGTIVRDAFVVSLTLGAVSLAVAVAVGLPLGGWLAIRRGTALDRLVSGLLAFLISVPGFVLAYILIKYLAVDWRLLPLNGWGSPAQAVLPAIAAAIGPAAYLARITRATLAGALTEDYVRTARAKGLRRWSIVVRHALPNVAIPLLSLIGPLAGRLLTGLFFIESIFGIGGVARLAVQSVFARDYNVLQGCVILIAATFLLVNLAADLLIGLADPRVRAT